ncbi:MAG: hypothetical protein ACXW3D_10900 [Caulobacteraceae bacterium]
MVAATLCTAAPAHAAWFARKARVTHQPVSYDPAAIDQLLYPVPEYDYGALDAVIRSANDEAAKADANRWRISVSGARGRKGRAAFAPSDYAEPASSLVSLTRTASLGDGYDLDIVPYARFSSSPGYSEAGGGGMLRLSLFGVTARDGRGMGKSGRWFVYGAAGGRAVGWNFANTEDGALRALGLTVDRTSAVISSAEAGIAWRKGGAQASLGYVRRKVRLKGGLSELDIMAGLDLFPHDDDAVAFTFSYVPQL